MQNQHSNNMLNVTPLIPWKEASGPLGTYLACVKCLKKFLGPNIDVIGSRLVDTKRSRNLSGPMSNSSSDSQGLTSKSF